MKKYIQQRFISLLLLDKLVKRGDKYNFRCPICGDSERNLNKKRGWLNWYSKGDTYTASCFNCNHTSNFYSFLQILNPSLLEQYKLEIRDEILDSYGKDPKESKHKKKIASEIELPKDLISCEENKECFSYVSGREVPSNISSKWFYNKEKHTVLIPFYRNSVIYGYQERSLKGKYFFNFLPEENIKLWNWYNVRSYENVYFTESIFDATLLYNLKLQGVALVGKTIPKDLEYKIYSMGDRARFLFDNDDAGKKMALEYSYLFPNALFLLWDSKLNKYKDIGEIYPLVKKDKFQRFIETGLIKGSDYKLKGLLWKN